MGMPALTVTVGAVPLYRHGSGLVRAQQPGRCKGVCDKEWTAIITEHALDLNQYLVIFETLPDALMVIEQDTTIAMVNRRFEELTGYSRQEAVGKSCISLIFAEEERERAMELHCMRRENPEAMPALIELWIEAKDGTRRVVEIQGSLVPGTSRGVVAIRDATASHLLQKQMQQRNRDLEARYAVSSVVSRSTDLDSMLSQILEKVLNLTGSARCFVHLVDEARGKLNITAHVGCSESVLHLLHTIAMGEGFVGRAARSGEPVFVPDMAEDPRVVRQAVVAEGYRTIACIPLVSSRKVLGVMTLTGREVRDFPFEERLLLMSVGHEIGVAVEKAQYLQKAQERARELGTLTFVTRQLASTLELREVLERSLAIMCMQVGADQGGICLVDEPTGDLISRSGWGESTPPLGSVWKIGEGVVGWVAQYQNQFVTHDLLNDNRITGGHGKAIGYRSVASVPLKVKNKLLGVVLVSSKRQGVFTGNCLRFLSAYGSQASLAIENALLYEAIKKEASSLAEALKRLSTSEARFSTLAAFIPTGLIERDAKMRGVRVNQALADMLGYTTDDLIGLNPTAFVAPHFSEKARAEMASRFNGVSSTYESALVARDGRIVPTLVTGTPLRDEDGNVKGILAFITDLSEIKQLRHEKSRAENLAAIGQMASVIAHEVRNPLAAISNSVYYLKMRLAGDEADPKIMRHLDIVSKAIASASEITEELLDLACPKTPVLKISSLNQIVEEAVALVAVPRDVELVTDLSADLVPVRVDHEMLKRVFCNLVLNAIQSIPEGGGTVSVQTVQMEAFQEVHVNDSGAGMTPEVSKKIFQPFFTTKAKGAGLGLYASKEIVEKHGGTLEVKSQDGAGTTMIVRLPHNTER